MEALSNAQLIQSIVHSGNLLRDGIKLVSQIFQLVPTPDCRSYKVDFASEVALQETAQRFEKQLQDLIDSPYQENAALGPLFEAYAHRELCRGDKCFYVRNVTAYSVMQQFRIQQLEVRKVPGGLKELLMEAVNGQRLIYLQPIDTNVESIDSCLATVVNGSLLLFQMTIGKQHPLNVDKLLNVVESVSPNITPVVYWIIPSGKFRNHPGQRDRRLTEKFLSIARPENPLTREEMTTRLEANRFDYSNQQVSEDFISNETVKSFMDDDLKTAIRLILGASKTKKMNKDERRSWAVQNWDQLLQLHPAEQQIHP
eukprot:6487923-Amphidinium_carterae.1